MDLPVAKDWFRAEDVGEGVTRLVEPQVDAFLESNVFHVPGRDRDLLVDAGNGIGRLLPAVESRADGRPVAVVVTHAHFDHVGGLHEFDDRRCHEANAAMPTPGPLRLLREDFPSWLIEEFTYYGSELPARVALSAVPEHGFDVGGWFTPTASPTELLSEGDVVDLGDRTLEVLHTPGHTAGSICLWERATGTLFSGDAIYVDARLGWEDADAFATSLERLRELPVRVVRAGHGRSFGREEMVTTIDATLRTIVGVQP